jgi:hypothetical protein
MPSLHCTHTTSRLSLHCTHTETPPLSYCTHTSSRPSPHCSYNKATLPLHCAHITSRLSPNCSHNKATLALDCSHTMLQVTTALDLHQQQAITTLLSHQEHPHHISYSNGKHLPYLSKRQTANNVCAIPEFNLSMNSPPLSSGLFCYLLPS